MKTKYYNATTDFIFNIVCSLTLYDFRDKNRDNVHDKTYWYTYDINAYCSETIRWCEIRPPNFSLKNNWISRGGEKCLRKVYSPQPAVSEVFNIQI